MYTRNNVHLIIIRKFYFEDVQFQQSQTLGEFQIETVNIEVVDNNENHNLCEIIYFQKLSQACVDSFQSLRKVQSRRSMAHTPFLDRYNSSLNSGNRIERFVTYLFIRTEALYGPVSTTKHLPETMHMLLEHYFNK